MSEMGTDAAAPTSTTDIVANVVNEAEQADAATPDTSVSQPDPQAESVVQETTTEAPKKPQSEVSRAAEFLRRIGHSLTRSDGRRAFMPLDVVAKQLESFVEEEGKTWSTERQTLESKAKELQQHIDTLRAAVSGDPDAFLSELAGIDNRYQRYLQKQQEQRQQVPSAADDPRPEPDFDLGNGQKTYSIDGMEKRMAWERRQAMRDLEGKIEERFKPIAEREKAEKQRSEQEKAEREFKQRYDSTMAEAQTWPLFGKLAEDGTLTEFQEAVLNELKADTKKTLTLEGAYIKVASKRMTEDDTAKRERLLKEINAAPKSTATGRATAETTRQPGPRSSQDIVREVLAKAGD